MYVCSTPHVLPSFFTNNSLLFNKFPIISSNGAKYIWDSPSGQNGRDRTRTIILQNGGYKYFHDLGAAKGFKIAHVNVRSIIKKVDQLRLLLDDAKVDVLTISESWLKAHLHSNLVKLEGYNTLRLDRAVQNKKGSGKRGGGLLTYVNTNHPYEQLSNLNISSADLEAQWTLVHRPHCKNALICNLYRPPNGNVKKALDYLDDCLKSLNTGKLNLFLLGDMNVDFRTKSSPEFKRINFFAQSNGLSQFIKNSTRNTDRSQTLIDIAFSNSKFVGKSGTLEHYISDHQPIYLIHKKGRDKRESVNFTGRSYRNFSLEKFKAKLTEKDWTDF